MAALAEHSNVYDTALKILVKKGFRVWLENGTRTQLYCAEKQGWDFKANSPCGLLGLIAIYEDKQPAAYREYWWKESGPSIYTNLTREAPPYLPIYEQPSDGTETGS